MNVLLRGVTGSRAYGLATEASDTDMHGVFASPTRQVLGLRRPEWSRRVTQDYMLWEAGNAIRLALASNPSVLELLFLPEYETVTEPGEALVSLRDRLITRNLVLRSYLRNAESQAAKMRNRLWSMNKMDWHGDQEKEKAEIRKRARAISVCLIHGVQLWVTGSITVPLTLDEITAVRSAEQDPVHLDGLLDVAEECMEKTPSPLREQPDIRAAEEWLLQVREQYWDREETAGA